MQIRNLRPDDFDALVEIGTEFHRGSRFSELPYENSRVVEYLAMVLQGIQRGDHCFFVAENTRGELIGLLHGVMDRFLFCSALTASEHLFFVKKDYRHTSAAIRLLSAFEKWAKNRDATEINIRLNSGIDVAPVQGMLAKTGFELSGWSYSRWTER